MNKTVSPTRTYVVICNKSGFTGYYCKKFTLPEKDKFLSFDPTDSKLQIVRLENDSRTAAWYFLNRLNLTACIEGCIAFEDYSNITDFIT